MIIATQAYQITWEKLPDEPLLGSVGRDKGKPH